MAQGYQKTGAGLVGFGLKILPDGMGWKKVVEKSHSQQETIEHKQEISLFLSHPLSLSSVPHFPWIHIACHERSRGADSVGCTLCAGGGHGYA
jgi:hypothetical protein